MATSSITIKIDLGVEGGSSAGGASWRGEGPTPMASGASFAAASGQPFAELPTPLGSNAARMAGQGDAESLAPSPSLVPGQGGEAGSGGSGIADIPGPLSAGDLVPASLGQSGSLPPTPFDSSHVHGVAGDDAPMPGAVDEGKIDEATPVPPPRSSTGKKGKS